MTATRIPASQLRLTIAPDTLGFRDASELLPATIALGGPGACWTEPRGLAWPWNMRTTTCLCWVRWAVVAHRCCCKSCSQWPPTRQCLDLCYLHNFDAPEHPAPCACRLARGANCAS